MKCVAFRKKLRTYEMLPKLDHDRGRGPGKMAKPDTVVSSHATGSENSAFERSTFELENVFEELRGLRAFSKGSVVDDRGDRFYIRGRKAPFFRDPCTCAP